MPPSVWSIDVATMLPPLSVTVPVALIMVVPVAAVKAPSFWTLSMPVMRDTNDAYARPVMAADHSGLPPAWVHSAEIDPIRDDGRVYASKLAMAGNWVTYREARGMIHGFMRARFTGAAARAEFEAICDFLSRHLNG